MKNVRYGFLLVLLMAGVAFGQVLVEENFNFSGNLTANGWTAHSGSGTNPIATTTGLSYSGYLSSGVGNAANVANTGEDVNKSFTAQTTGVIYAAFLAKVDVATAGYFVNFVNTATTFAGRVWVQPATTQFQFGLSNGSTAAYNTTTNFNIGTTYLCVLKYEFSTSTSSLWVISSGVPATEVDAGTALLTSVGSGQSSLSGFALRQYNASQRQVVDGIRVGQTWSDAVASASVPSISLSKTTISFGSISTGSTTAEETYNVSGVNLTADITITAPSGYSVSKVSGGPYTSSVTVAHSGGTVSTTPIYAVFSPSSATTYSGNITHASTGATTQNVAVTGDGVAQFYSAATGNLDVLTNWGTSTDGTGSNPANFTDNYQVFNIRNNATPTIAASWTVSGTGSKIVLGDGTNPSNFTIPDAMTVTGTIDVSANGTLTLQNATLSHTYGTLSSTSTINYAQSGTYTIPASPTTYGHLKITGGTKTLSSGTLTIQKNLTVDGVTDFNGAGTPFSTLNIGGDFILQNSTTFAADVANRFTVNCNGTSAQTFYGNGSAFHLFRILMNNSNGLVLSTSGGSSNVTVGNTNASAGGVTLTSGGITTNSNAITFYNGTGAVIQTPVETAGKEIVGTIIMTKTVGTAASSFGSSGISIAAGTDDLGDVTITRVTGTSGIVTVGANNGIARKYTISSVNPPTAGRDVTITWLSSNDNSKTLTSGTAWKSTNSGTSWTQAGSGDYSARSVVLSAQTSFGVYTVSDAASPLPVELTSFTATVKGRGVELVWKTATEVNNAGFEIERNVNGSWNKIGFVEGNGTTNAPKSYTYTDASANPKGAGGTVSYRLKQIDRDGKFEYSNSVNASVGMSAEDYTLSQNFPNPFNPNTNITFAMKNAEHVNVTVYNALGQVVSTLFNDVANANQLYTLSFDGKDLSSGTYFYSLRSATRNEVRKMSLMK
jgi:hypothetical protein